ncbi:hypothetical protein Sthe_3257 [Sphaerobacter thermophilus DSM 20745]|uniref:Uncharacterized protein n=1 Tax=Sphaerobacter thermophilus (strain ATCC 49802 / DSM 20745 / KCCM 41009 / NCIMB 13125 / S 6022) TaxID=479434 RepID=D1CA14_SPHTD|nr:hypothetical protein Sthe_3257 [Sphaerobacter thermophilus DSM 20745]
MIWEYAVGPCPGVGGVKDPTPWRVPGANAAGLTRRSRLKPARGQNSHSGIGSRRSARARG